MLKGDKRPPLTGGYQNGKGNSKGRKGEHPRKPQGPFNSVDTLGLCPAEAFLVWHNTEGA